MAHQKIDGLFDKVYRIVTSVPKGKVTTYGLVAKQLGTRDPRKVGWALHANKSDKVPCHRVVSKDGNLAENFAFDGYRGQKERLEREGVTFVSEKTVDLEKHLYDFS